MQNRQNRREHSEAMEPAEVGSAMLFVRRTKRRSDRSNRSAGTARRYFSDPPEAQRRDAQLGLDISPGHCSVRSSDAVDERRSNAERPARHRALGAAEATRSANSGAFLPGVAERGAARWTNRAAAGAQKRFGPRGNRGEAKSLGLSVGDVNSPRRHNESRAQAAVDPADSELARAGRRLRLRGHRSGPN